MNDRSMQVFLRSAMVLAVSSGIMVMVGHLVRPDVPIAERAARMVTGVAPVIDGVFSWFRTWG